MFLLVNPGKYGSSKFRYEESEIQSGVSAIFSDAKHFNVEDLFAANLGILELRYKNQIEQANGKVKEVIVLRPGLIREADNAIKPLAHIRDYYAEQKLRPRPKEKGDLYIPEKYLLRENDLLITTKGKPRLIEFSSKVIAADEEETHEIEYVASHHFITLRPRIELLNSLGIQIKYLTEILRLIVDVELPAKYEEKVIEREREIENIVIEKGKRSISAIMPSLSLKDDILPIRLPVPMQKDKQDLFIEIINELTALKQSVEGYIDLYHSRLLEKVELNK